MGHAFLSTHTSKAVIDKVITEHNESESAHAGQFAPPIISSTKELIDGEPSNYPPGTLYVVFEED